MGKKVQRSFKAGAPRPGPSIPFSFHHPLFWLLLITLLGGAFRFYSPNWNLGHEIHPDERNILNAVSESRGETGYKVSFFAYGQLPAYLYRATGEVLSPPRFLFDLFHGNGFGCLAIYWPLLLTLFIGGGWYLQRQKWEPQAFWTSVALFTGAMFFKFFNIFNSGFAFLNGQSINLNFPANIHLSLSTPSVVSASLVILASLGISFIAAWLLEVEWSEWPLYSASGAIFLFGLVPAFLPESWNIPQILSAFSWMLIVLTLAVWFAWKSRWGRLVVGLLPLWAFFASLDHGGISYTGADEIMIIGHVWAAFFSTLTILVIYLFVQKAYGNIAMALLASACFAFAVMSIEQAHYLITESFITFMFVVVAICAWRITEKGGWNSYLWAGAAFGLAMAAKTSSLYYVLIILVAHCVLLSRKSKKDWEKEGRKLGENKDYYSVLAGALLTGFAVAAGVVIWKSRGVLQDLFRLNPTLGSEIWVLLSLGLAASAILLSIWGIIEFRTLRAQAPQWLKLISAGGLSIFFFCLFSPWSLLDFQKFMESQNYEWGVVSVADACYVLQFKDTPRYLYQLSNLVKAELWWPLGLAAVLGMAWVLGRFIQDLFKPSGKGALLPVPFFPGKGFSFSLGDLLVLCWFIPYFGFIGCWNTKFIRYMAPLIPAFCIFGARLLTDLIQYARNISFEKFLKPALWLAVVGPSLFYSLAYMHVYAHPHPWFDASVWISKNVPPGSVIATDTWDDGLPQDLTPQQDSRLEKPVYGGNYGHVDVDIYSPMGNGPNGPTDDNDTKKNYYADTLQKADYISLATKKLWYTLVDCTPEFRPQGYNIYPVTSRYFRLLWSGLLGYKMVGDFHNFPEFLGWVHPDDMFEETFSVYDHPRAYLFKKVESISRDRILKLLSSDEYVKGIDRDLMLTVTPANVDDFIAQRRKYLEDRGLWQQLEETEPVTTALAAPVTTSNPISNQTPHPTTSTPQPAAAPITLAASPRKRRNPVHAPSPTPTVSPWLNPEAKVEAPATIPALPSARTLNVLADYAKNPVIENDVTHPPESPEEKTGYLWMAWFKWLLALLLLGWMVLPLTLKILSSIPGGAYSLSKVLGFFIFAWLVWFPTSLGLCRFTLGSCWFWFLAMAFVSGFFYWRNWDALKDIWKKWSKAWFAQELAFFSMFVLFTFVKLCIPHIHDPVGEGYNGGGEPMNFAFLSSIVRGETFPPQDMWMAGLPIGYTYYYGHIMMGILTKFLGLVPAVSFNLGLITLFALIFSSAFGLAFALSGRLVSGWIAGILCALAGNPDGIKQYMEAVRQCFVSGNLSPLLQHVYDYWGPTRVIPPLSINEFPYFSVLYGDMHAHTLAMPNSMLLIGIMASLYLAGNQKPFRWEKDWSGLLMAGFLLGGLVFLNTWEVPAWLVLITVVFLIRNLSGFSRSVLIQGLSVLLISIVTALTFLGWWATFYRPSSGFLKIEADPNALGGATPFLVGFFGLGSAGAVFWLWVKKSTRIFSKQLVTIALDLGIVLAVGGALWFPYFLHFYPQQNKIMWVLPRIRTSVTDYFAIYGFFLSAMLLSFVAAFSREIGGWIGKKLKVKGFWDFSSDEWLRHLEKIINPSNAVGGMLSLGFATLAVVWGASWAHWSQPPDRAILSEALATLTMGLFAAAIYFRDQLALWAGGAIAIFIWVTLLVLQVVRFDQDQLPTLQLGVFSVLWLLAFLHMGFSVKMTKDRPLSFAYILVSFFFLLTAVLEVFVMSEYFGFGDGMRNNSLFKYGIVAWMLASIGSGIFLPKIWDLFQGFLKTVKKESREARGVLCVLSAAFLFVLLRALLDSFIPALSVMLVGIFNIVFAVGLFAWAYMEGWIKGQMLKGATGILAGLSILFSVVSILPAFSYGTFFYLYQQWCENLSVNTLFPGLLASLIVTAGCVVWEKKKNLGTWMMVQGWKTLMLALAFSVLVYPIAATTRKCHGFLPSLRQQWMGYAEPFTLNGISYISRVDPYDAAAIRFLNEKIPDQPCLLEFVGGRYEGWSSRFSIFTGIPAIVGWDEEDEWVGARLGADLQLRRTAVQQIYSTTDVAMAKKYMDAYGIRLVIVGMAEKYGPHLSGSGKYTPEGLTKFSSFLPMIYKNPEVEIYYNPPSSNQSRS